MQQLVMINFGKLSDYKNFIFTKCSHIADQKSRLHKIYIKKLKVLNKK